MSIHVHMNVNASTATFSVDGEMVATVRIKTDISSTPTEGRLCVLLPVDSDMEYMILDEYVSVRTPYT